MKNKKIFNVRDRVCYPKLVYHIVITSEQAVRELDSLMGGRCDMRCDYAQSLLSRKAEQATLDKV